MRLFVIKPIRLKRAGKLFDIAPAAVVSIPKPDSAQALINSGHVRVCQSGDIGEPFAARIFSKILDDEIWVVKSTEAMAVVPEGAIVYHPEEIRNLRHATPEDIRTIHMIKKELGGTLISEGDRA